MNDVERIVFGRTPVSGWCKTYNILVDRIGKSDHACVETIVVHQIKSYTYDQKMIDELVPQLPNLKRLEYDCNNYDNLIVCSNAIEEIRMFAFDMGPNGSRVLGGCPNTKSVDLYIGVHDMDIAKAIEKMEKLETLHVSGDGANTEFMETVFHNNHIKYYYLKLYGVTSECFRIIVDAGKRTTIVATLFMLDPNSIFSCDGIKPSDGCCAGYKSYASSRHVISVE